MKFAVTGGAGFIGSHLVDLLVLEGHEVVVIDNLSTSSLENIAIHIDGGRVEFINSDISQKADWCDQVFNADIVFHLAGLAAIVPSIENPESYFASNVTGTLNVLQSMSRDSKIVYAASSSCYGIPSNYPTAESEPLQPMYPYALTKMMGEQLVLHWNKVFGIRATSLRLFNVYGLRARCDNSYGAMFGVFLAQLVANLPLTIVGDGSQTRDFVYVTDVAKCFYLAAITSTNSTVMNVGSGFPVSVNEICSLLGGTPSYIPKRPGEPDITHADITLASRELGWSPEVPIERGVEIMKKNIDLWINAPQWTPESISKATDSWFKFLSD